MQRIGHTSGDGAKYTIEWLNEKIEELEGLGYRGIEGKLRFARVAAYQEIKRIKMGEKTYKNYTKSTEIKIDNIIQKTPIDEETKGKMRRIYIGIINSYFRTMDLKNFRRYNMYFDSKGVTVGSVLIFNVKDPAINPTNRTMTGVVNKHTPAGIEVTTTRGTTFQLTHDMDFTIFRVNDTSNILTQRVVL